MVFGDSGQQTQGQVDVAARIAFERPSFVLHLGDIAYSEGTFEEFQTHYFDYYRGIMSRVPFFATPGNHEYTLGDAKAYLAVHGLPSQTVPHSDRGRYYSFDWGNAHFVSLDSNLPLIKAVEEDGPMLRWLEHDLNATRQFWRIVFFHHPPYAVGPNENQVLSAMARESIVPILERYGVQVVLNGHEHSYQRSQSLRAGATTNPGEGTVYITSGGGGGELYPVWTTPQISVAQSDFHYLRVGVNDGELTLKAINGGGTILDTFNLKPSPVIEPFKQIPAISLTPGRSAGALIRIMGRNLAIEERYVAGSQFPALLGGAQVTINDQPIQLIYASANEIFGRVPFDIPDSASLRVTTRVGATQILI
jgi:predicted phosphodiesterase